MIVPPPKTIHLSTAYISTNGASSQPTKACLWSPVLEAPVRTGETVTGKPDPVYEPSVRLVGLTGRPNDRAHDDRSAICQRCLEL